MSNSSKPLNPLWPGHTCNCTHSKDSHADEHDEIPTGTGHCTIPGCGCSNYTRSASTQLAQELTEALEAEWQIGTSSQFCDDPADWDSADTADILKLIEPIIAKYQPQRPDDHRRNPSQAHHIAR